MAGADAIEAEGLVIEALPHGVWRVELSNGHRLLAHVRGRQRRETARFSPGEKVLLEMTPFDLSRGCIIGAKKET